MHILDMYVLREFLLVFIVMILAFTLLFILIDTYTELSDFTNDKKGVPVHVIITYFMMKLPSNLSFVFPITVLLASMYTLANFGRHREITAMRASGISILRCGRSMLLIGLAVTAIDYYFLEKIIPYTTTRATYLKENLKENAAELDTAYHQRTALQFHSGDRLRTWYFAKFETLDVNHEDAQKINKDSNIVGKSVRLKFFKDDTPEMLKITGYRPDYMLQADEALYENSENANGGHWVLRGHITRRDYINSVLDIRTGAEEQTLGDRLDLLEGYENITETPDIIVKSVVDPELLSSAEILTLLKENQRMPKSLRCIYETIFFHRISFPFSCFICALIALPLAAKNERSGIFASIMSAVIIAVIYQLADQCALILGKHEVFPQVAMLPTIGFFVYGIFLALRSK